MDCKVETHCLVSLISSALHGTFIFVIVFFLLFHAIKLHGKSKIQRPRAFYRRYPAHTSKWLITIFLIIIQTFSVAEGIFTAIKWGSLTLWYLYVPGILAILGTIIASFLYDHIETFNNIKLLLVLLTYWTFSWALEFSEIIQILTFHVAFHNNIKFYITWILWTCHLLLMFIEVYVFKREVSHSDTLFEQVFSFIIYIL